MESNITWWGKRNLNELLYEKGELSKVKCIYIRFFFGHNLSLMKMVIQL